MATSNIDHKSLIGILDRIRHNGFAAKGYVEAGQEIFCGRRIDAIIDQLNKLIDAVAAESRDDADNSVQGSQPAEIDKIDV